MSKTVSQSVQRADNIENKQPAKQATKIEPPKSVFREYFESFAVTLIMAFFGMTFIVQAVTVPTGSMENTINIGDNLLVNKFIFAPGPPVPFLPMREIRRGDIIVFKYPGNKISPEDDAGTSIAYQTNFVKRVVGLPGDSIEYRDNRVYINGEALIERRVIGVEPVKDATLEVSEFENAPENAPYTVYYNPRTIELAAQGQLPDREGQHFALKGKPYKIPDDSYFVIGDNRDNSYDSRYWGSIPRELIVGRAMFVYWSCDQSGVAEKDRTFLTCFANPRLSRIGTLVK